MKLINKTYRFLHSLILLLTAMFVTGCEKEFQWSIPLAVTQNGLDLTAAAGSTRVTVYATGSWSARMLDSSWGKVSEISGEGVGDFLFTYTENKGVSRRAQILISGSDGHEQQISLSQAGAVTEPTLRLAQTEFEFVRLRREDNQIGVTTNLTQALDVIRISASDVTDPENTVEAAWLTNIRLKKDAEENVQLTFDIARNDDGKDRKARILLEVVDADKKVVASAEALITQTSKDPSVVFTDAGAPVSIPGDAHKMSALLTADFDFELSKLTYEVSYNPTDAAWISNVVISASAIQFAVAENSGEQPRSATLKLRYKDSEVECSSELTLTQEVRELSISDLRALIPETSGTLALATTKKLSAQVISDAGNFNMEVNPNLTASSIDFSVNDKTAYIQSLDGKYGIRITTKLPADNILTRYSSVQLSVKGLTLTKESNPVRYTLSGFTKEHVLSQNAGTAANLPRKEKFISELTDDDIYTYTTLKACEFMLDAGAYVNIHDGYCFKTDLNTVGTDTPGLDCGMRGVIDSQGEKINMLLNTQVRWRRKGDGVPAGSGPMSGIVVHSKLPRYGVKGDIGTYQIRPVDESDIAFSKDASSRNYKTLVRWSWPGMTTTSAIKQDEDGYLKPYQGEGRMFSSVGNKINASASAPGIGCTLDYNNLGYAKGNSYSAVRYCGIWWNAARNQGEYMAFDFSTQGISTQTMKLIFSAALGNLSAPTSVAPLYWDASYSLDQGASYTKFATVPIRTIVYWGGPQWFVPGLGEVELDLPSACAGQQRVTIKLQAASKVCATATGEDNGTTSSTYIYFRFGDVSVKYL